MIFLNSDRQPDPTPKHSIVNTRLSLEESALWFSSSSFLRPQAPLTFPSYVAEDAMQALSLWSAGRHPSIFALR